MNKREIIEQIEAYSPDDLDEIKYKEDLLTFINSHDILLGKGNPDGHITASAWVINEDRTKALMTWHRKLDRWLQLGGHTEVNESLIQSAIREVEEESSLRNIRLVSKEIFDIDIHKIPNNPKDKAHYHYDVRFLIQGSEDEPLLISEESKDLAWIPLEEMHTYNNNRSVIRMVEKITHQKNSKS